MAWLRASTIDRTPRGKRGDSYPRHRLGIVASTTLCGFRDTAIRDTVHAVPCRADSVVDGHHPRRNARSGQRSCGNAFPRIRNLCASTMWEPDVTVFALGPWVVIAAIASWLMRIRVEA
jgi:hypothetical protein